MLLIGVAFGVLLVLNSLDVSNAMFFRTRRLFTRARSIASAGVRYARSPAMTSLLRSGYNALATPAVPATATLSAAGTLPVTGTAGLTSTYGCPCGDHTEALSGLMNRLRQDMEMYTAVRDELFDVIPKLDGDEGTRIRAFMDDVAAMDDDDVNYLKGLSQ